jgi:hypothetical protein
MTEINGIPPEHDVPSAITSRVVGDFKGNVFPSEDSTNYH